MHSKLDSLAANVEKSGKSRGTRLPYTDTPKRNKQVDVPTEAWQKSVERRLDKITDVLFGFVINERVGELNGEPVYRLSSTKYHQDLDK